MLKKSLFWGMAAVLITASFGFMGCADEPPKSDAKSIIAFSVNDVEGAIDEDAKRIAVTLPANSEVTALSPVVVVSKAAQIIDPGTGAAIGEAGEAANQKQLPAADFTYGKNYVVKAEDDSTQTYFVEVTVLPEETEQFVAVTVALPNNAEEPAVYGAPEGGVILSRYGKTANAPAMALISVDGSDLWKSVKWYIDGTLFTSNVNIIIIKAESDYTLSQPHAITFVGTKGGVEYSKTIGFTVVK
ncbi:MAG: hypothetical protein LBD58_11460 [Treponema sp.]|jgi:hypothetical protein|nr:hypothetical protein [Treponema sp.]